MEVKPKICSCTGKDSGCIVPIRYFMVFLIFWATFLTYLARTSINLTIVSMVNDTDNAHKDNETGAKDFTDQCPYDDEDDVNIISNTTSDSWVQSPVYDWDASIQSLILSSFYFGYICTQIPGGLLAERFGFKWTVGVATLAGGVLTLLTPLSASYGVGFLIAVRVVGGLFQGVIYPSCIAFVSVWIPGKERNLMTTIIFLGGTIGTVFSMEVGGYLCKYGFAGGWPSVYYVFGSMSVLWFVIWVMFGHNSPENHPRISEKEKLFIRNAVIKTQKLPLPWKSVLTSLPVLSFVVCYGCSAWTGYILLSELPTYLQHVLHLPIDQNGSVNALVYVVFTVASILAARFADWLITSRKVDITLIRKSMQNLGHYGTAACFLCIPFVAGCNTSVVITLLVISRGVTSIAFVSDCNIPADMAPLHSGTIFGIANALAALMGLLSPMVTGLFLKDGMGLLSQWRWIFCINASVEVIGAIVFLVFGSAEKQPWGTPSADDEERCIQKSKENHGER